MKMSEEHSGKWKDLNINADSIHSKIKSKAKTRLCQEAPNKYKRILKEETEKEYQKILKAQNTKKEVENGKKDN